MERNIVLKNKATSGELLCIIIFYHFCDEALSVFKWKEFLFFTMFQPIKRKWYNLTYQKIGHDYIRQSVPIDQII